MRRIVLRTSTALLTLTMIPVLIALSACGTKSEVPYTSTPTSIPTPTPTSTSVLADWPLQLVGAQSYSMTEAEFQNGASHHADTYTDLSGTWTGLAIWRLIGWVDDGIQHGSGAFNDALANAGYSIKVSGADGYYYTFDGTTVKRNNNVLVAYKLNGKLLPKTDPANSTKLWYPLRIIGAGVQGNQEVGAIVKIELLNLTTPTLTPTPTPTTTEVEATEFQGTKLTPIKEQGNNALAGTQIIDENSYMLTIDGVVDHPLTLTYTDLLSYPQESWLMDLNCVEGWNFTAKWTGPELNSIFNDAKVKPEAKIAIFYTADVPTGYSSLDISYIHDNNIIIALKLNDVTLPPNRGFPFQVVAKSKYGYKWAKWVTRIELSSDTSFRGYWESRGYNNNADVNGPAYD